MSWVADFRSDGALEKPSGKPATLYVSVLKVPLAAFATPAQQDRPAISATPKATRSLIEASISFCSLASTCPANCALLVTPGCDATAKRLTVSCDELVTFVKTPRARWLRAR